MKKIALRTLGLLLTAAALATTVPVPDAEAATCRLVCRNRLAYYCCVDASGVETCTYRPNVDCIR